MQIHVNTDSNVTGREELADHISTTIEARLARFRDYLTRVEVHLADESAGRTTGADKRCMIEARPAGREPIAVTTHASTVDDALTAAINKLTTVLARETDRRDHHKGSASIRTGGDEDSPALRSTDNDVDGADLVDPDAAEG